MKLTKYSVSADVKKKYAIAVITDLHNSNPKPVIKKLAIIHPDFITIAGDILYAAAKGKSIYEHRPLSSQHIRSAINAQVLLRESAKIAPVMFSTGNHELYLDDDDRALLSEIGICFLDDEYIRFGDLVFGGLSSPYRILAGKGTAQSKDEHKQRWEMVFKNVNAGWIDEFGKQEGYKILLCHHPEYYQKFLKDKSGIDLIFAGHAHGGQIRLFGRGLFAYGQGFFPKYTKGIYDGELIVSAGLSNTSKIPRIGNPTEVVCVEINPGKS